MTSDAATMAQAQARRQQIDRARERTTGEAVALEVFPAGTAIRCVAYFFDIAVMVAAGLLFFTIAITITPPTFDDLTATMGRLASLGAIFFVPVLIETVTNGRSLGKLITGLRVVRDDLGPIRFRQVVTRALMAPIEIFITSGFLAVTTSVLHPAGKRLGDVMAGTIVISTRGVVPMAAAPVMPAHLQTWAEKSDLGRIPDHVATGTNSYLQRATSLTPQARTMLRDNLSGLVLGYVRPHPPAENRGDDFLSAVMAERFNRTVALLTSRQQRREKRLERWRRSN